MIIKVALPKWEKTSSIKLSDYLKKPTAARTLPLALPIALTPALTQAATNQEALIKAFDPLIDLAQAMGYPLCFLGLIGGFLFITIGQRHRGLEMIKWAIVGYIGIQFAPGIMRILMQVGQAMRATQ